MRLGTAAESSLPPEVMGGTYDRDSQRVGIVHFGIGAFHRAHMAWYTQCAMAAGERDWMICGVSLRSDDVARQLNPQDGLYTLTEQSGEGSVTRLIGCVREVLFAPDCEDAIVARIAEPSCHIVSFTVTEKGYARGEGNALDFGKARSGFYPLLTRALAARRDAGLPGVTLLSCDNLPDNGAVLDSLMRQWLAAEQPNLSDWFAKECSAPATMVDRIVPRTTEADRAKLEARIGMADHGAVFTEAFSQWVIADGFSGPRPSWERYGAQLVADVAPYEEAKLRMLNGAHSLLAYAGLRAGYEFVHEAVADPTLRALADRLMRHEALPTLSPAPQQDLNAYADTLLARFADPALRHRLAQIAMDGTQKIPQRWLDTALALRREGKDYAAIAQGLDAWLWHIADGRFVDDPFGQELRAHYAQGGRQRVALQCFDAPHPIWPGYEELAGAFRAE